MKGMINFPELLEKKIEISPFFNTVLSVIFKHS